MSWFGLGGGNNSDGSSEPEKGFSDTGGEGFSSSPASLPTAGAGGAAEFQQFSVGLQQQLLVQTVITDLTHRAFEKCCNSTTRDPSLTGREVACIHAATNKWLDTNEYLAGRLSKKQEQASQAATQFS